MSLIVQKFGGSSVKDAQRIRQLALQLDNSELERLSIQVSDTTSVYYVHSNFLYRQNPWGCALFVLCGFFFAVSGSQALWKYLEVCRSIRAHVSCPIIP